MKKLAYLIPLLLLPTAAKSAPETLAFLSPASLVQNTTGTLPGTVKVAQTHTIDPAPGTSDSPHLIAARETLVIFIPSTTTSSTISVEAYDKAGKKLGTLEMAPPELLPLNDNPHPNDVVKPNVIYAKNAWTANLPWQWVQPGLTLTFKNNRSETGRLTNIEVGAENHMMVQNTRVGMLTTPLTKNDLEQNKQLAADYFQKLPVSLLTIGNYSEIHFSKIVLPDGTTYNEPGASKAAGDVYSGDMRSYIAKELVSIGIDNANYGINTTEGGQQWQPQYFNQVTDHIARGVYTNGIIEHGLSGGGGIATLYETLGNEFSHELGHHYGLGHYPENGRGSLQGPNTGWGWDAYKQRFIANFFWDNEGTATVNGDSVAPFAGVYRYNTDPMAGGSPSSPLSQYTLPTLYTQKIIQKFFENTGIQDLSSSTGYRKWDPAQKKMVEKKISGMRKAAKAGVPVVTLVGFYDPQNTLPSYVYPPLFGSYGNTFDVEAITNNAQCVLQVNYQHKASDRFPLQGSRINSKMMNKFHVNVERALMPTEASIICSGKTLSKQSITSPAVEPVSAIVIGKEQGYLGALEAMPLLKDNALLQNKKFKTPEELENTLSTTYGPLKGIIAGAGTYQGKAGSLFRDKNLNYYFLKTNEHVNQPGGQVSDKNWKFLGNGSELINFKPHPLLLDMHAKKNPEELLKHYFNSSKVYDWSERAITTESHMPFFYENIYNGKTEYFLQKIAGKGWYFPINQKDNSDWIYLGNTEQIKSTEGFLKLYYNANTILDWEERTQTTQDRQLFLYNNPYNKKDEYFLQKVAASGHYFPINQQDNGDWIYLGNKDEIELLAKSRVDKNRFDVLMAQWYGQEKLLDWDARNLEENVGKIFFYDNGNPTRRDYFEMKFKNAGYFPTNQLSNDGWTYVGTYQ
jgi:hypothetical protein